jgi:hypothetical protein
MKIKYIMHNDQYSTSHFDKDKLLIAKIQIILILN